MKYCLNCMCRSEYLDQADEIYIPIQNSGLIYDIIKDYPNADLILQTSVNESANWQEIVAINEQSNNRLIICCGDYATLLQAKTYSIKHFYEYPISTYYELNSVKDLDVCYLRLSEPLFFDLDRVSKYGIPIRAIPNIAYKDYLPHENGIHGTWIRPEDVDDYEQYIDILEFDVSILSNPREKEEVLFKVYKDKYWPNDLNILITNLNYSCDNKYVSKDRLIPTRFNCRQNCEMTGHCHLCEHALDFGKVVHKYHENLKEESQLD